MRILLFAILFFLVIVPLLSVAQFDISFSELRSLADLQADLAKAKSSRERANAMIALFIYHSSFIGETNKKTAEQYRKQLEHFVSETNDSELTARSLWWQTLPEGRSELFDLSIAEKWRRIDRLDAFAKLKGLMFYQAMSKIEKALSLSRYRPDNISIVHNLNDAISLTKGIADSLRTAVYLYASQAYLSVGNYLQAIEYAHKGYEQAIKIKNAAGLIWSYDCLGRLFTALKEFKKANEYFVKEIELLQSEKKLHLAAATHALVAGNFILDNQPILADRYIRSAEKVADSLRGSNLLYRQISIHFLHALVQSERRNLLPDFFKYVYRESLNERPNDKFLFLTASALVYDWFGVYDSVRPLMKNAGLYITDDKPGDIQVLYYTAGGSIASHQNDLDVAAKNYQRALRINLLSNNVIGGLNLCTRLQNISEKQHRPERILYFARIADSLRILVDQKLHGEEVIRGKVIAFERKRVLEKLVKERPKSLSIALCMIGFVVILAYSFVQTRTKSCDRGFDC